MIEIEIVIKWSYRYLETINTNEWDTNCKPLQLVNTVNNSGKKKKTQNKLSCRVLH